MYCRECPTEITVTNRVLAHHSRTKTYYKTICKACHSRNSKVTARLRASHMMLTQGSMCELCGKPARCFLDHNHRTGAVRGIVCRRCNSGLGLLGDSQLGLWNAIGYIYKHDESGLQRDFEAALRSERAPGGRYSPQTSEEGWSPSDAEGSGCISSATSGTSNFSIKSPGCASGKSSGSEGS